MTRTANRQRERRQGRSVDSVTSLVELLSTSLPPPPPLYLAQMRLSLLNQLSMFSNKEIHRHLPCNTAAPYAGDHKNGAFLQDSIKISL